MHRLDMFKSRTQHISKALIQEYLADSNLEDGSECASISSESLCREPIIPRWKSAEDLLGSKSWLDQMCAKQQAQCKALASDSDKLAASSRSNVVKPRLATDHPAIDTSILQRIHQGRGPRDTVPEDLLAVFRGSIPRKDEIETYEEMKKLLLSWNERVSTNLKEDEDTRPQLRIAVEKRRSQLRSRHGCLKQSALEKSSIELQQALTGLRPETAGFQNQEDLDILTMMWAYSRLAIPDLDVELRALTMKILLDEVESKSNAMNAEKHSRLARSLTVAQLEGNEAEVERLTLKSHVFQQRIRDVVVREVIDRIKVMRKELTQLRLKELRELTELQAAQKWVIHARLSGSMCMQDVSKACDDVDGKLRRVLQKEVPELDAHVQVAQSNANGLARMSASLLARAKNAGVSLENEHKSTLDELAKADIKTYISGTVAEILDARTAAAKMLGRMDTVERHFDALLDAAKSQYRAYDDVLRVLEGAEPASSKADKEIELAGKYGPRRESILLMARNAQRVKHV